MAALFQNLPRRANMCNSEDMGEALRGIDVSKLDPKELLQTWGMVNRRRKVYSAAARLLAAETGGKMYGDC